MKIYLLLTLVIINLTFFFNLNYFAKKLNLFDHPDNNRKIHNKLIPLLGGPILFFNISLFLIYELLNVSNSNYIVLFLIVSVSFIISLINDKKNIDPKYRLIIFYIIFLLWVYLDEEMLIKNLYFNFLDLNINLGKWSILITPLFILIFFNALNLFDGVNLQTISYTLIYFLFLYLNKIPVASYYPLGVFVIFFIFYNFKNRIFLGDSGVAIIAIILSFLTITNYNNSQEFFCEEIFFIMFLPGVDMVRLYFQRMLKGKHPFAADNNHIHHYLSKFLKYKYVFTFQLFFYLMSIFSVYYLKINTIHALFSMFMIYVIVIICCYRNRIITEY